MALGKVIEKARLKRGWKMPQLSEASGVDVGTINALEKRGSKKSDYASALATALGIDLEAALRGELVFLDDPDGAIAAHPMRRADDSAFDLPQYRDVLGAMGKGILLRDQPGQITGLRVTAEWLEKNVPSNTGRQNLCVVTGFGDSMKGMYNSGDPLLVDTGVKSCEYDGVYFFRVGEEGFIKRLQRIPGQGILVISENRKYRDWTITEDMDFEIFAKVLKVWESTDF